MWKVINCVSYFRVFVQLGRMERWDGSETSSESEAEGGEGDGKGDSVEENDATKKNQRKSRSKKNIVICGYEGCRAKPMLEQNLKAHTKTEHGQDKVMMKDQPTIQSFFKRSNEVPKDTPNKKKKVKRSDVFEEVTEQEVEVSVSEVIQVVEEVVDKTEVAEEAEKSSENELNRDERDSNFIEALSNKIETLRAGMLLKSM